MDDSQDKTSNDATITENEYPIIFYEPNVDWHLKIRKEATVRLFSELQEAVDFARSQKVTFLLIAPKDLDKDGLPLQISRRNFNQRRILVDVEEESILKGILDDEKTIDTFKVHLFYSSEDQLCENFDEDVAKDLENKFWEEFSVWRATEATENPEYGDSWKEEEDRKYKEFCIERLKEMAKKKKREKEKVICLIYLGKCCYELKEYGRALECYAKAFHLVGEISASSSYLYGILTNYSQGLCQYYEEHPELIILSNSFDMLAYLCKISGKLQKAFEYMMKCLDMERFKYGEMHSMVAYSLKRLAQIKTMMGDYQESLEYCWKTLEIMKSVYGEIHSEIADIYYDIAVTYREMEDYQQELEYQQKAFEIRKIFFGEKHKEIARSYFDIALAYAHLKEDEKAAEYFIKEIEVAKSIFGEIQHPSIAYSYANLALTFRNLGQDETALEYYLKVIEIRKCNGEERHPENAVR